MPIVALAFHEQIAMEKLNQYFSAHEAAGESRAINCPRCSLGFAMVLVDRENKNNAKYIEDLQVQIGDDCINGLHRDEYTLTTATLPEE